MSKKKIVEVALGEVGVKEDLRNNEDKAGRIAGYIYSVTDSRANVDIGRPFQVGDAWCAAFASWVYENAGHPLNHPYGTGFYGCGRFIEYLQKQEAWFDRSYVPSPGDLIFFDWQGYELPEGKEEIDFKTASKVVDHVGIVGEVKEEGVVTVEGNWGQFPSGGVKKLWRPYEKGTILGYGCLAMAQE